MNVSIFRRIFYLRTIIYYIVYVIILLSLVGGALWMPTLSTGLVIAGAYADKLRRTLFAQLRNDVKEGKVSNQEVARAAAEMNQLLFHILVEDLKMEKGDAVRVRVDYSVEDGTIKWNLSTLTVEAFKRMNDDEVQSIVKKRIEEFSK